MTFQILPFCSCKLAQSTFLFFHLEFIFFSFAFLFYPFSGFMYIFFKSIFSNFNLYISRDKIFICIISNLITINLNILIIKTLLWYYNFCYINSIFSPSTAMKNQCYGNRQFCTGCQNSGSCLIKLTQF